MPDSADAWQTVQDGAGGMLLPNWPAPDGHCVFRLTSGLLLRFFFLRYWRPHRWASGLFRRGRGGSAAGGHSRPRDTDAPAAQETKGGRQAHTCDKRAKDVQRGQKAQ